MVREKNTKSVDERLGRGETVRGREGKPAGGGSEPKGREEKGSIEDVLMLCMTRIERNTHSQALRLVLAPVPPPIPSRLSSNPLSLSFFSKCSRKRFAYASLESGDGGDNIEGSMCVTFFQLYSYCDILSCERCTEYK
jgi:hypothetical protein